MSNVYERREMESTTRAIGREIAAFMFEQKLTLEKMAALMSMTTNTLRYKRDGRFDWKWSEILRLSELTGKSPDELAGLK